MVDDIQINSKLTEGEDVADLGGTILAYIAWKDATKGKKLSRCDGLTPDQRFFVGFAQWACENERPEDKRARAITDPHSPAKYRVNGVVVNMPEFGTAFGCKAGSADGEAGGQGLQGVVSLPAWRNRQFRNRAVSVDLRRIPLHEVTPQRRRRDIR